MRLSIVEVKPGMQLEQAIMSPATGNCLLSAGTILSIRNIDKIKELKIEYVDIADRYSVFISPDDKMSEALVKDFTELLRKTCPLRPEANMNDKVVAVANQLEGIIPKIARSEQVVSFLVEQKIVDNKRLYECSLYSAVLSGIVAGCMDLPLGILVCCISGALLHEIGMCEMPILIKEDKSKLTGQKEQLYREHPQYGYHFAVQKNIPRKIAECIRCHHERWDGSGFPKGLEGEDIPIDARIVGMCSDYAEQIVCNDVPPYVAVEEIYGASGIYYDYKVVQAFINNIPIYPLGEIVRLSTKEVGIVSNIRKNEGPRPVVKVYYNRVNRPITEDKIIDLAVERTVFIEEIL